MDASSDEGQQNKERSRSCRDEEESENLSEKANDKTMKKIKFLLKVKKIKIAREAKEKGLHSTSRKYNIDRKPLRRWVNNIEKLKKVVK